MEERMVVGAEKYKYSSNQPHLHLWRSRGRRTEPALLGLAPGVPHDGENVP